MNYDFSSHQHHNKDKFDPYEVLDLPRDSDMNAIRQRFRMLTRTHHPDRNRNNSTYDGGAYYSRVCAAYEILSDPRKRAAFDQQNSASWNTLRDASRDFTPATPRSDSFSHRGTFSDGDLRRFNEAFEQGRAADPNDRGYGDQMAQRMSLQDAKRGYSADVAPTNVFGSGSVSGQAFNSRFEGEMKSKRQQRHGNMMERGEEPMAWNGGIGTGGSGFTEVSIFDGMMIDQGRDDFTKTETGGLLNYSDYMSGFDTFTDQLPEDHEYFSGKDVKKAYSERLSQQSQLPDRGHNRSFADSERMLNQQRDNELKRQQEHNKAHVLRFRDQYSSDDLLPPPRVAPGGATVDHPRPSSGGNGRRGVSGGGNGGRPPVPIPDSINASFRPSSSSNQFDAGMINDRMMDRMMDPIRTRRPNW